MKTSESMAVPVYNFYTIKVRSTYVQIQNNYSAISEVILKASDALINAVISFLRSPPVPKAPAGEARLNPPCFLPPNPLKINFIKFVRYLCFNSNFINGIT
jgi:hypothetical protein